MLKVINCFTYFGLLFIMMPSLKIPSINVTISDVLFILVFILLVIVKNKEININLFMKRKFSFIYYVGVTLFILGFCISSIINGSNIDFFTIIIQYMVLLLVIPIVIVNSKIQFKKALVMVLISMSITIIIGIYLYTYTTNNEYSIGGRMGSLFKNPNTISKNIALLIPLILLMVYGFKKNIYLLLLPLFAIGLILASSFGGLIASFLSIFLFFFFYNNKLKLFKFLLFMSLLSLVFIMLFGLPEIFEDRILSNKSGFTIEETGSLGVKKELMIESVEKIKGNLFIGVGLGNYTNGLMDKSKVHNSYLLIFSEGGILSLLGFLLILYSFLKVTLLYSRINYTALYPTAMSILLTLLLNLITNVHVYNRYVFIAIFIITILPIKELKGDYNYSNNSYNNRSKYRWSRNNAL